MVIGGRNQHMSRRILQEVCAQRERLVDGARNVAGNDFHVFERDTPRHDDGGDRLSLGFVVETERQVEAHLKEHLEQVAPDDQRTRLILAQMKADEARHGSHARRAGGTDLPSPLPAVMTAAANVMKAVAYRF